MTATTRSASRKQFTERTRQGLRSLHAADQLEVRRIDNEAFEARHERVVYRLEQ